MFYENRELGFLIQGVFYVKSRPQDRLEKNRTHSALSLRIRGNTTFTFGETTLHAGSGTLTYLPAGVDYRRKTEMEEEAIIVHLTAFGEQESALETVENAQWLQPLFETLLHEWESGGEDRHNRCMSVLYSIFSAAARSLRAKESTVSPTIAPGAAALEQNFRDPSLTVGSLAARCHISEAYFRRLYRAQFGQSPQQALLDRRFGYAQDLLRSGYYQTKQIAALAGFSDVKYFRTAFRKRYGITPNEYAQNAGKKPET